MPHLKSFFGLELSTGARAAAAYTLLVSFPLAAEGYLYLKALGDFNDDEEKLLQRFRQTRKNSGNESNDHEDKVSEMYDSYRKFSIEMGVSYLLSAVFLLASSICLLRGISKENPRYMWPWLVTDGLATGYFLYRYIYNGIVKQMLYAEEPVIGAILLFIATYFFLIVYSYKQLLTEAASNEDTLIQPNTVMGPQQYAPAFKTDIRDLPPPYSACSLYHAPPSYSQSPPPYENHQNDGSILPRVPAPTPPSETH